MRPGERYPAADQAEAQDGLKVNSGPRGSGEREARDEPQFNPYDNWPQYTQWWQPQPDAENVRTGTAEGDGRKRAHADHILPEREAGQ